TRIASCSANSSRRPGAAPASLTFVAALCFFVALFAQLAPLQAQAVVTNRVLELDGKDGYVELPPRMFEGLHEATVEGWVKWRAFGHYFRFLDYGRASDTLHITQWVYQNSLMFLSETSHNGFTRIR